MYMIADKFSGASSVPKHRLQGWNSAKEEQWRHGFELCFLPVAAAPNPDSNVVGAAGRGQNRYSQGTVRPASHIRSSHHWVTVAMNHNPEAATAVTKSTALRRLRGIVDEICAN